MSKPTDLVQGTLDLLILKALTPGRCTAGPSPSKSAPVTKEVLQVQQGSLYPALHKLETHGLIAAEWGESENNRRAKYYSLTRSGPQTSAKPKRPTGSGCRKRSPASFA